MRRTWGIALIACGLVFGGGVVASVGTLSATGYAQPDESNWYWAAASQMIIKYLAGNAESGLPNFPPGWTVASRLDRFIG